MQVFLERTAPLARRILERLFLKVSNGIFPGFLLHWDWVPHELSASEQLSRFVFSREHLKPKGKLALTIFSPPKDKQISVYRIGDCTEWWAWRLGYWFVARKRTAEPRILRGWASVNVASFKRLGLTLDADRDPHVRHVNTFTWRADEEWVKLVQLELANQVRRVTTQYAPK
jgi:hypothetical protein